MGHYEANTGAMRNEDHEHEPEKYEVTPSLQPMIGVCQIETMGIQWNVLVLIGTRKKIGLGGVF